MDLRGLTKMKLALKITAAFMIGMPVQSLGAATMSSQPESAERPIPGQVGRLLACRDITDSARRLACFDQEVGTVATAVASKDLVIVDREGVRRAKRTLFGLTLPQLGVFDDDREEVSQIDGEVEGVGRNSDGGYIFVLKDGGRWSQTDSRPVALEPERGDKVVVKRAALGSYILSVNRQPGVRVKRVN